MGSAFIVGAALAAAGFAADIAGARGLFVPFDAQSAAPREATGAEYRAERRDDTGDAETAPRHHARHAQNVSYFRFGVSGSRRHDDDDTRIRWRRPQAQASVAATAYGASPVCVRLCDGYFFPLAPATGDVAAQGSACNSLCPDAPTEVYYRTSADRIEDAISASGKRYSALPVSLRYRTTLDNTCTCHRDVALYAPLHDATLRRGDAIMTPAGFVMFNGAEGGAHGAGDFAALASAPVTLGARAALQAMERVSVVPRHPSLKQWLSAQSAPAAPARPQVDARVVPTMGSGSKIRLLVWHGRVE